MKTLLTFAAAATVLLANAGDAVAQGGTTQLANICRLKGQEENVLRGIGLVVGLNGTGESNDIATMRALSRALELMGNPVSTTGRFDEQAQDALRKGKNIALVMVTATVPATGARSGDRIGCTVSAVNGKSLVGGQLISAALQGPNTQDGAVYALCEGSLQISDPTQPMVANIHGGCQMSRDVLTPFFSEDGWVTIVLDPNHADFVVAESIADQLATFYEDTFVTSEQGIEDGQVRELFVQARNAQNIRVKVPQQYETDQVAFVAQLLERQVYAVEPEARVVCNTRTGSVVISGEVEIGDVVFTHRNLVIETGNTPEFAPISASESVRPKLDRLIEALANLRVPPNDVIEIIRGIDRLGKLHAKLIIL